MSNSDQNPRAADVERRVHEAAGDEPASPLHQQSVVSRIRNYFLTGLILVGPLYITFSLTWWFINWVDDVVRPFVPAVYRPETYLPFQLPGSGLIIAFATLTLLGFLTANLVGRKLVEFGERHPQSHADRAAALSQPQADLRDAVLEIRIELPPRGSGGISCARHVVGRVLVAAAERRRGKSIAGHRAHLGIPAVHAESDHRFLLLPAAPRRDRARHHGRSRR